MTQHKSRRHALKANQQRRDDLLAQREIIRSAFDAIRHDKEQAATVDRLAGVLGGRYPLDQAAMDLAQSVLAQQGVAR